MNTPSGRGIWALLFLLSGVVPAQGDWSRSTDQPGLGTGGRVFALGTYRNELVVGTYRSPRKDDVDLQRIGHFDGERWQAFGAGMNGAVRAVLEFQGDLYAGGEFTFAGGQPAAHIARWDGSRWQPVGAGFDGPVWSLAEHGGELLAGGDFSASGSVPIQCLARWNGQQWQPVGGGMTWSGFRIPKVYCLLSVGGQLYAGGEFDRAGATAASHVARWDGTSWRALGGGINNFGYGTVWDLAAYQGRIYAGGVFGQAGTVAAEHVAAWDGTAWSALGAGVQGGSYGAGVNALAVFGGSLYLGGSFILSGTLPLDRIARWDGAQLHAVGGVDLAETNPPTIMAMTAWNQRLYCGGEFLVAGTPLVPHQTLGVYHIAAWDGQQWSCVGRGLGFDNEVLALGRWRGQVVAGGRFLVAGGQYASALARFDGDDWRFLGTFDGVVRGIVEHLGDLWVAGEFYRANGIVADGVARFDGSQWHALGAGPGPHRANCIAEYQGQIHIGTTGQPQRWNGTTWQPFGNLTVTGTINRLQVHNGILYLGGATPFMPGAPHLLAWDGAVLQPVGGGLDGAVEGLGTFGGDLIVGGRFTRAGTVAARSVARWDGSRWSTFGTGVAGTTVQAATTFRGQLVIAGDFSRFQGENADYVARWDGTRWQPLGSQEPNGAVFQLLADDTRGELHLGGHFSRLGTLDSDNYAVWQAVPSWTNLGRSLGTNRRTPILWGEGALMPGALTRLIASSGLEHAPVALVCGGQRVDLAVLGGTLVPAPAFLIAGVTDAVGLFPVQFPWPAGVAPGAGLFLQAWLLDPAGPQGATASNGLWLRVP